MKKSGNDVIEFLVFFMGCRKMKKKHGIFNI